MTCQATRLNSVLGLLLALAALLSLGIGSVPIPFPELFAALLGQGEATTRIILLDIRLPRTLTAMIVGASLGMCGAAVQGLLRNPLASPDLTGATSGGALGAVIMIYFGAASLIGIISGGMLGALVAVALVHRLGGADPNGFTLVLAGVAVSSFSIALISLLLNLAPNPYAVQEIVIWMLGSVTDVGMDQVIFLLPLSIIAWLLLAGGARGLDALTLGEDTAATLGIHIERLKHRIFVANALGVGAAVSLTGAIGFVGLAVPHLLRPLVNWMPGLLLWPSALGGALMVLLADILVRLFPAGSDLKIGVITSLAGAPFFLHLILRMRSRQ
jgi:iron complex transport system permease protein